MDGRGKEGTFIYERIGRVKHVLDWLGRVASGCQKQTCGWLWCAVCRPDYWITREKYYELGAKALAAK